MSKMSTPPRSSSGSEDTTPPPPPPPPSTPSRTSEPASPLRRSSSAPFVMETLRRELAAEHEKRLVAEKEGTLIRYLSPFEKGLLFCYARAARVAHAPKPRCVIFGGPIFWLLIAPSVAFRCFFGVSPLVLVQQPQPEAEDRWFGDARRPAVDVLRRRGPPREALPVVMVPGMTSTALEVWQGVGCFAGSHRRRLWSSPSMLSQFVLRPRCLQRHLFLNASTWDDPDDIKVRASSGLSGADAFGPLNLWGELMANLAILGYDERSMRLLGFDWRLSAQRLEARDGYFTILRREVELLREVNGGKRVAVLAHSLGANHYLHFMQWVERLDPGWVDANVAHFVPICGALLGSAKALAYLYSGEMTDAVGMGPMLTQLFERHGGIERRRVAALTRSWASVPSLLPKGGDAYWRGLDDFVVLEAPPPSVRAALERDAAKGGTVARVLLGLAKANSSGAGNSGGRVALTVDGALDALRAMVPAYGALLDAEYDLAGPSKGRRTVRGGGGALEDRALGNPLLAPLPKAPRLEVWCLYGVGRPTPRTFKFDWAPQPRPFATPGDDVPEHYLEISDEGKPGSGVLVGDGDGTVPLVSLGYLCASGYGAKRHNPARARVKTKEYGHEDIDTLDAILSPLETISGLANDKDSDHVTVLGNREMTYDIIDIVAYGGHAFEERIESDICALAQDVVDANPDERVVDDGVLSACKDKRNHARKHADGATTLRRVFDGRKRRAGEDL